MKRIATTCLFALVLTAGWMTVGSEAQANEYPSPPVYPDMMNQYYVADPYYGYPAEMYTSPITTPPYVPQTYITYPPLDPHEFLYKHHRTYYHYYNGGQGLNRTKVHWYGGRTWLNSYNPFF
ncbi:hypothetical protein ACYFX5_16420 [Bremerella sp. T1]|uniref:hypothetical protein n=1 Tax=Bremerella sp. TYQ1 TaxID=3119568 RepID=UPI001CCC3F69|nr:hypothetical protein [Bremerella volcania]UBM34643.1 hypothetical protein LA756_18370 [Bremerella volcania]